MSRIEEADLERMKWYGYFYRKNNDFDHYMCRVRMPGCEMTARQARALAYVAYESGYSIVDLTTRGNVQIQGLKIDRLPAVRAALERAGLDLAPVGPRQRPQRHLPPLERDRPRRADRHARARACRSRTWSSATASSRTSRAR